MQDTQVPALIFDQMKYSDGDSSTIVGATDIINGFKKLRKERFFLYDDMSKVENPSNQISALKIQEESVVYFWNVSRSTVALEELEASVARQARDLVHSDCSWQR